MLLFSPRISDANPAGERAAALAVVQLPFTTYGPRVMAFQIAHRHRLHSRNYDPANQGHDSTSQFCERVRLL